MKKKELLEMIRRLERRVDELERTHYSRQLKPLEVPGQVFIPSVWTIDTCSDGGAHEYPQVWNGIFPPPCKKCGKASPPLPTVTCTTATSYTKLQDLAEQDTDTDLEPGF